MSTFTLREIVLDALTDAFWYRKGEVEDCPSCRRSPGGVCGDEDHQLSLAAALAYEEARKRIENSPGDPEVVALLGTPDETACAAHPDDCPNGPEPHLYVPPDSDRLVLCCRQPGEETAA